MKFTKTRLNDAFLITLDVNKDTRGTFMRTYCAEEFKRQGISFQIVQSNISYNQKQGTLRGMHFQKAPHSEAKLVQCLAGALYDVLVDLRPDSPTYRQWEAFELSAEPGTMLYVPTGFAHGFQTRADHTIVYYHMSEVYHPESSSGVRWNDPLLAIRWPATDHRIISDKDQQYEDLLP